MQRYYLWQDVPRSRYVRAPEMCESDDGDYVLYSDVSSRLAVLEEALRACIAYMEDDSGGYEVYRAILDAARAALESPHETR